MEGNELFAVNYSVPLTEKIKVTKYSRNSYILNHVTGKHFRRENFPSHGTSQLNGRMFFYRLGCYAQSKGYRRLGLQDPSDLESLEFVAIQLSLFALGHCIAINSRDSKSLSSLDLCV